MQENIIVRVGADITNFSRNIRKVSDSVSSLGKGFGGIADAGRRAASGVKEIVKAAGLLTIAYKGIDMVKQSLDSAIDRYDTLNNFPRVMQQIGFDAQESSQAIKRLSDGIQGLPTTLDSVAKTAQRLAVMTGDLDGAVETTLALNNAFLASGASSADAARGLEQYIQMLSTGTVDLQSWRTLQETMGVALNDVAKAFGFAGKSAQNDLYAALKDGKITFDEFNKKIIELSNATGGFAERARTATGGIKTSWQNVKTAVVRGVADVIGAIDEALGGTGSIAGMFDSLKTVVDGFFSWVVSSIPKVAAAFSTVKDAFEAILNALKAGDISGAVTAASSLINSFIQTIIQQIPTLLQQGRTILQSVINGIVDALPVIIPAALSIIETLINNISSNIQLILTAGTEILFALVDGIIKMLPQLIDTGILLINKIVDIVAKNLPRIINAGTKILIALVEGITDRLPDLITLGITLIIKLASALISNLPKIIDAGIKILKALIDGIIKILPSLVETGLKLIVMLAGVLIKNLPKIISAGVQILSALLKGIAKLIPQLLKLGGRLVLDIAKAIIRKIPSMIDAGADLIRGLWKGIVSVKDWILRKIGGFVDDIVGGIKKFFKIGSPSKLMANEVGRWIPAGLIEGIIGMKQDVMRAANKLAEWATPDVPEISLAYSTPSGFYRSIDAAVAGTIDVTASQAENREILERIYNELKRQRNLIVEMDRHEVGRLVAPVVDEELGRRTALERRFQGW